MDASLLMSPDYVSPLVPSDLPVLVSHIFSPPNISWLRHSAAKKFILWRESSSALTRPQSLYQPLTSSSSLISSSVGGSYALARINDHTQREERIAQIRLANWAADLQRSLQNERARFDALARNERAVWLTERLGECVQDGSIVPIAKARQQKCEAGQLVKQGVYSRRGKGVDRGDPLGLLSLNEEVRRRGWVAVRILGGCGILGGLAFWIVRTWTVFEEGRAWGLGVREWLDLGMAF